jgi:hypothetical protein
MFGHKPKDEATPAELASLYLAADEARWLAEEHGLTAYWEVARVLSEALPPELADTLDHCWAHASVMVQEAEGDRGYYRRLECHAGYLRAGFPSLYAAVAELAPRLRAARACALDAA